MRHTTVALAFVACGMAMSLFTPIAHAHDSHVNCSSPGQAGSIAHVLSRLDPADTNIVYISGYCHENLVIRGFDRLSLIAAPGTVIGDASGGQAPVVDIGDSQRVLLQDFTIRGGSIGVNCWDFSFCRLNRVTIKQTAGIGLAFANAQGQLLDSTIQDTGGPGINMFASKLQAQRNSVINAQNNGISLDARSQLNGPGNSVKNSGGTGVWLANLSQLLLSDAVVTGNGGWGIFVAEGSNAELASTTVTNNKLDGVFIQDVSSVYFFGSTGGTYSNNGTENQGVDILCGQLSTARFIENTQTGLTNCPVPAPNP